MSITSCYSKQKIKERPLSPEANIEKLDIIGYFETGPEDIILEMKKSALNLNYKLDKVSLSQSFNFLLDTILNNNPIYLEDQNIDLDLIKKEDATIEFQDKSVLIDLPLQIIANKKTFLQDILVDGELHLSVITDINIDKYWNLFTKTDLIDYYWKEKPQVKIGSINLPIEKIMNLIIDRTKANVVENIDLAIKEKFALKSQVVSIMDMFEQPFAIDQDAGIDLYINIDSFAMSGTYNSLDWTTGIISVGGYGEVKGRKEYSSAPNDLPIFTWIEPDQNKDTSHLYFNIEIELNRITNILTEKFTGQKFSEAGKEITIQKIEIKGMDDKLGVIADVEGSYNGKILISANPRFDREIKSFVSENIEISLLTKNIVHKALGWMLKGRIKSELDKLLKISLVDFIEPIQNQLDLQVQSINKQGFIELKANIKDLDILEFRFSETKIHGTMHVPIELEMIVSDFNKLF